MKKHIFELAFYFLLVISIGVFLFFIFKPFIGSIFLAVVFASVLYPAYRYITKLLQNRSTFSAIVTVVLFVLLIFIPLAIMLSLLLEEVLGMYSSIASGDVSLQGYLHSINAIGSSVIPAFDIKIADVYNSIQSIFGWVLQNTSSIFSGLFSFGLNIFIFLMALFYFLKDGPLYVQKLIKASPLADVHDVVIVEKIGNSFNSVIRGSLVTAILQGILAGVGFAVAGVGAPALLGFVTMIAALIPSVGTGVVMLPVVIYLLATQAYIAGILLFVWAVLVVGLVDNVLRPVLMHKGLQMHSGVVLLSVLGGVSFFGPIGLIAGPVLTSIFYALVLLYPVLSNHTES